MRGEEARPGSTDLSVPPFAVRRPRLEARLDEIPAGGVGAVIAAAGSGKSVLVAQWLAARPDGPVVAVSFEDRLNDPVALGRQILAGLGRAGCFPDPALEDLLASGARGLGVDFFELLGSALEDQRCGIVVAFDDLHLLSNPVLAADLGRFVSNLPPTVRVVLTARWDPDLGLRRLRLAGRLVEVRSAELAFDDGEATRLIQAVSGHELDDEQSHLLVDRTDGWAAGLRMAGLSLRLTDDHDRFLRDFAGNDRLVVEYLTAEVLDLLPSDTRRFLLQTSVLPWLTGDLCAAVTGRDDVHVLLRSLCDDSMFVVELDRTGNRFRYYHLFAEILAQQASVELGADELRRLRLVAAAQLQRDGAVAEAVELRLDADDSSGAFAAVMEAGEKLFGRGESDSLVRWLTRIERCGGAATPVSMNLLAAQVAACQFLAAGETYARLRRRGGMSPAELVAADALYACCGIDQLPAAEVAEIASRVLATLPTLDLRPSDMDYLGIGGPDTIEILAGYMAGLAQFHAGDPVGAASTFDRVRTLPGMRFPIWRINVLGACALMRAWTGLLTEAWRLGSSAMEAASAVGAEHHVASGMARLALGLVCIQRSDPVGAETHLGLGVDSAIPLRGATDVDARAVLVARATALIDGPGAALDHLAEPARCAVPPEVLQRSVRALRAQWHLSMDDLVAARLTVQSARTDPLMSPVRFDLELAEGSPKAAREILEQWSPDSSNRVETLQFGIRRVQSTFRDGDREGARQQLEQVVALAEAEQLVSPLADFGSPFECLDQSDPLRSRPFVRRVIDGWDQARRIRHRPSPLPSPFSDREMEVLVLLPTRLTNAAIGRELFMSVNTVKTHLRSVYMKLGVGDRDAAVTRAREMGLL